jgi:hypothetical protein
VLGISARKTRELIIRDESVYVLGSDQT